jgi:hypothetical protein
VLQVEVPTDCVGGRSVVVLVRRYAIRFRGAATHRLWRELLVAGGGARTNVAAWVGGGRWQGAQTTIVHKHSRYRYHLAEPCAKKNGIVYDGFCIGLGLFSYVPSLHYPVRNSTS